MNYIELKELIGNGKVKTGDLVYICDYRYNDINNKAIRHIKPQKVAIVSNNDIPKNKTVYYSDHHFRPLTSKGLPSSKIIAPYDNTGYRFYTGTSLNIFLTEKECIEFFKKQCDEIIETCEAAKIRQLKYYNDRIEEVDSEKWSFE